MGIFSAMFKFDIMSPMPLKSSSGWNLLLKLFSFSLKLVGVLLDSSSFSFISLKFKFKNLNLYFLKFNNS